MSLIFFHGKPIHTVGDLPEIGSLAPDFALVDFRLNAVGLADYEGKRKLLCILTSLDTPICAAVARQFNQLAKRLVNTVVLVISADLPFAQCRFCETEGLQDIIALSSFRSGFTDDYGVKIGEGPLAGLCARAVVMLDESGTVVYSELVNELTKEPDYKGFLVMTDV